MEVVLTQDSFSAHMPIPASGLAGGMALYQN